jgi:hypothetical protein
VIVKLPGKFGVGLEQRFVVMKRTSLIAIVVPTSAGLCFVAPSVMGCILAFGALIFGFSLFDQLLYKLREHIKTLIHRQSFKPPANFVAIGVILSVVCAAIGFFWNPQSNGIPTMKLMLSLLSVAGHFICLGALGFAANMIEAAPNIRNTRG